MNEEKIKSSIIINNHQIINDECLISITDHKEHLNILFVKACIDYIGQMNKNKYEL